MKLVQLAREADHRAAAEGHDDRAGTQAGDRAAACPVERRLALEEADLGLRKRVPDEWQRLDRAEQQDVPVLAAEQEPRPRRAALLVLGPLHLVEHERLALQRGHLGRAADDRRARIHTLLARDEPDRVVAELRREPAMSFLRKHAERRAIDAAAALDEEAQRVVRLPRVRRPEMRDDGLRLGRTGGQPDSELCDRLAPRLSALVSLAPGRSLLAPGGHSATVVARRVGVRARAKR